MRGLYLGLSLVGSTAIPLPTPLAVSDFKNGAYSIGGVSKTLAEMWVTGPVFPFSASDVVADVGLTITSSAPAQLGPSASAELFAALGLPQGDFAVVMEFETSTADTLTGRPGVAIDFIEDDWTSGWDAYTNINPDLAKIVIEGWDALANTLVKETDDCPATGSHKFALNAGETGLRLSVDGRAVIVSLPSVGERVVLDNVTEFIPAVHNTGTTEATATIKKLTFYPYLDDATLVELSA
jgi:hypothetical protein